MCALNRLDLAECNLLLLRTLKSVTGSHYRSQKVAELETRVQQLLIENNQLQRAIDLQAR